MRTLRVLMVWPRRHDAIRTQQIARRGQRSVPPIRRHAVAAPRHADDQ
jgi:hypothetical protein